MITWAALALAIVQVIASLLDARLASKPARDVAQREKELQDDLDRTNQAITEGDAAALAQQFEHERVESAKRMLGGNGRLGTVRLHGDGAADPGEPHA